MSKVKGKNTAPELLVRRKLWREGFRFRLHRPDLPGKPDIVLPKYRTVVHVHGCFWHQHPGCRRSTLPATQVEFWEAKLGRNVTRDLHNEEALQRLGWQSITVWECETKAEADYWPKLARALGRDAT